MRIILDVNVLLISLPKLSPFRIIFDSLRTGKFDLGLSTDIILEYEEKLSEKTSPVVSENVLKLILHLDNVSLQHIYFNWSIMHNDPEDNKYVDCAISFGADYIVTEDNHFKLLKNIKYPAVKTLKAKEFCKILSAI